MRHYGIIGFPLEHSFSPNYFNEKFATCGIAAEYSLCPIGIGDFRLKIEDLLLRLDGFNVTYPYKETIIPYLDGLDETARVIGAVNVVKGRKGYNTDYLGFMQAIHPLLRHDDRQALVLGTGGAAKAVCYALRELGISPTLVSRTPHANTIAYEAINEAVMDTHTLVINCTPLGMYPQIETCPEIPYSLITARHLLFDCVYNPEETRFLRQGKTQGARVMNGKQMLIYQAEEAWKIWSNEI